MAIERRQFLSALGGASLAWPLAARAQQPATPVVGWLSSASPHPYASRLAAFREGLNETGYSEGQNVFIEYRWAENQIDRLPALAAELVHRQASVIAAGGSPTSALAAKSLTTTIPIVFTNAADPVRIGLVASLNRPGGNITGVTTVSAELGAKRLGVLHDLLPSAKSIAMLVNPARPGVDARTAQAQEAAHTLGMALHILNASNEGDFDRVFRTVVELRAGALVVAPDALFTDQREQVAALAKRYVVPTMYELRDFVEAGGLISYGAITLDLYRQSGTLVGRILKGEKPEDLPVQQPTKFELVINLKTAKALGLTIPPGVFAIADEVIE